MFPFWYNRVSDLLQSPVSKSNLRLKASVLSLNVPFQYRWRSCIPIMLSSILYIFHEILYLYEIYQILMVIVNYNKMSCSNEIYPSFFQYFDNGHELLVINRIIELDSVESSWKNAIGYSLFWSFHYSNWVPITKSDISISISYGFPGSMLWMTGSSATLPLNIMNTSSSFCSQMKMVSFFVKV